MVRVYVRYQVDCSCRRTIYTGQTPPIEPSTHCYANCEAAAVAPAAGAPSRHLMLNGPIHTRYRTTAATTPSRCFFKRANRFTFCVPASALAVRVQGGQGEGIKLRHLLHKFRS